MHRSLFGILAAAVMLFASTLPVLAEQTCEDFVAYYRIHDVYTDDRGEPGAGPADVRHGAAELFDASDSPYGEFY